MSNEAPDTEITRDVEERLRKCQAQALLDLFKEDCGRTPTTLMEVREWANAQRQEQLQFRVNRCVDVLVASENSDSCISMV